MTVKYLEISARYGSRTRSRNTIRYDRIV